MKDEEMAEKEYKNCKFKKIEHYCDKAIYVTGFLAGLKAGRPQWHKVADGDLPKEYKDILICFLTEDDMKDYVRGWYEYDTENDKHIFKYINVLGTQYLETVIAWCEIPTFDKE